MSHWILQSDPKEFRLINWLQDFNWVANDSLIDCWHIDDFVREILPGDTVFIWTGNGEGTNAGIYGEGKIIPKPDIFPLANRKREYFTNPETINSIKSVG